MIEFSFPLKMVINCVLNAISHYDIDEDDFLDMVNAKLKKSQGVTLENIGDVQISNKETDSTNEEIDVAPIVPHCTPSTRVYTLDFLHYLTLCECGFEMPNNFAAQQKPAYKPKFQNSVEFRPLSSSDGVCFNKSAQPIQRGDSAWNPKKDRKEVSELDKKIGEIKSDVNKIAPENEAKITKRVVENITEECLPSVICFFFGDGLLSTNIREIYARLCCRLHEKFKSFQKLLLLQSQKVFEQHSVIPEGTDTEVMIEKMKMRLCVGVFMVDLLRVQLITANVVVLCIGTLMKGAPDEYSVCHVADIMIFAIPLVKTKVSLGKLKENCEQLKELYDDEKLTNRAKFKVEELMTIVGKYKLLNQKF